jgi:hypothetical protein
LIWSALGRWIQLAQESGLLTDGALQLAPLARHFTLSAFLNHFFDLGERKWSAQR